MPRLLESRLTWNLSFRLANLVGDRSQPVIASSTGNWTLEHKMTLRVYRVRPGEAPPPDTPRTVVAIDSATVSRDDFTVAATAAWPPCRCPIHRAEVTS